MRPTIEHLCAAGVKRDVAEKWLPWIQRTCEEFRIDSERRIAAFIAQTAHESAGYTALSENLNYSAATMATVWPARFAEQIPDPDKPGKTKPKKDEKGKNIPNKFALALERKPEAIANVVYASRLGNGPTETGDGWSHRGMGLKQLTGKDNHKRCGDALGADFVKNPELLLTPEFAARSAGWFWSTNKCSDFADKDDFVGLTKKINGGTIGLEDRTKRYKAVLAVMGI